MNRKNQTVPRRRRGTQLTFAPLAWLKLQFFCHRGDTEIAGFGITAKDDPLYVEDFQTVRQRTSVITVVMDDEAVADYADGCVDRGLGPQNFMRIWCHTHPGLSAHPSGVDEETFARIFGSCDWAVMFILSRDGHTTARLSFHVGPGGAVELPVYIDWSDWPTAWAQQASASAALLSEWQAEFAANIHPHQDIVLPIVGVAESAAAKASPWEPFADTWDWAELDRELLEEYERHE